MDTRKFESPPDPDDSSTRDDTFEPPAGGSEPETDAVAETLSHASANLLEVRAALERQLETQTARLEGVSDVETIAGAGNLQGAGVGLTDVHSGGIPGEPALVLFIAEPAPIDQTRRAVARAAGVSESAAREVPMRTVVTGLVDAAPHRFKLRPAPGGVSVAHFKNTAGTFGCLCVGRTAPRNGRTMILGNNHVLLASVNNGAVGDCIVQPGPLDGGTCAADQVAVLEGWATILGGGQTNYVDCATGWAWPDRVRRELMYLVAGKPVYFKVAPTPILPAVNMAVGKTGRTTQLTSGWINAVGVTITVNYKVFGAALFKDQISITNAGGNFAADGDSGALIWRYDSVRNPVGLLFAVGGATTFANRITVVLNTMQVNMLT